MNKSPESSESQQSSHTLERSSSPFDHVASYIPFPSTIISDETIEPTQHAPQKSGNQRLAETIAYQSGADLHQTAHLLRAAALTYIEKLTLGKPPWRKPQCMSESDVRQILFFRVPEKYFLTNGWSKSQIQAQDWVCDDAIARAAAEYITHLKSDTSARKNRMAEYKRVVNRPCGEANTSRHEAGKQEAVEMTLDKIEAWCETWLAGKIYEADWDCMEECL